MNVCQLLLLNWKLTAIIKYFKNYLSWRGDQDWVVVGAMPLLSSGYGPAVPWEKVWKLLKNFEKLNENLKNFKKNLKFLMKFFEKNEEIFEKFVENF